MTQPLALSERQQFVGDNSFQGRAISVKAFDILPGLAEVAELVDAHV